MKKGIFVTATSTGIGKTIVSGFLCSRLAKNYKVTYYKPVQSGLTVDENNNKISGDCRFVKNVLKDFSKFETFTSYLLAEPASPHYSASLEGVTIDLNKIKTDYDNLSAKNDFVIVEGAGGLFVPLDDKGNMMADIPLCLNINTVLVGNAGLGAINQTGLSYKYALSKNINITAIILISAEDSPSLLEKENARILKQLLKIENVFIIPKVKGVDTENNITGNFFDKIKKIPDINKILSWINE